VVRVVSLFYKQDIYMVNNLVHSQMWILALPDILLHWIMRPRFILNWGKYMIMMHCITW